MIELWQVLTLTYFIFEGKFYEQTDGVGSPLAPVVANFYMEYFEETALRTAQCKPSHWFRYTLVVLPHGEVELQKFLLFLNSIHQNIIFTMDIEKNSSLPFLDVLVNRQYDGSLGHTVYRKPTHTDLYFHAISEHHPAQKRAILSALINQARTICDSGSLEEEMEHLKKTF
jgi:hypothetical protein